MKLVLYLIKVVLFFNMFLFWDLFSGHESVFFSETF